MLEDLLKDILQQSHAEQLRTPSEKAFIESILNNIYQFLYKNGQPVHTVAIGILRGSTFDMYYRGRLLEKYVELFGAMSYDTTIAGRACELYKKQGETYLFLPSRKSIKDEFAKAGADLAALGLQEESESLVKRANVTVDQGVGSFLLMPLFFGTEIIGIFTISSLKPSDAHHFLGGTIDKDFVPIAEMLSLILCMEKISYEKAEDMGRLLISSIDAKDEYQATHSLNVRTMIDIFIAELSRDRDLRERVESIGFKLTVDRIERLRLAALLHDIGKIFVPSDILRKSRLDKQELLVRKMHPYLTYNILKNSKTLKDIAEIASLHHARYYIPVEKFETNVVGYPFDRIAQGKFAPESQIIALADTVNSIIRLRPDRKGLPLSEALDIIEQLENKFHEGLKDIFLTIMRRVEKNLEKCIYPADLAREYRDCLWLNNSEEDQCKEDDRWIELHQFLKEINYNNLGFIAALPWSDGSSLLNKEIMLGKKTLQITTIPGAHVLLSIRNIPKEDGFKWIAMLHETLKKEQVTGKFALSFIGKTGESACLQDIYEKLKQGLDDIKNEPVHYYLNPEIYKCK